MRIPCYHSVKSFLLIPRTKCNFSGCPTVIAKLFGGDCLFEYDYEHCVGYIPNPDPRMKDECEDR